MKILKLQTKKQKQMQIIEFHTGITNIKRIIVFNELIMKNMKILEFLTRITRTTNKSRISLEIQ